jgi:hypothetical protein
MRSHKLDPWPLDEGPRPKKWQIKAKSLHGNIPTSSWSLQYNLKLLFLRNYMIKINGD